MKRLPPNQPNHRVYRERDFNALSRLALLLFCGLTLAGGFVFAAQQHFAAIQYGYRNESLRRERQRLLEEQQRLLLEEEQASSPRRLESAARELGLQRLRPGQVGAQREDAESRSHPAPALISPSAALQR